MYDRDAIIAAVDLPLLADELLGPRRGRGNSATWRCPDPHHAQTGKTPPMSIFTSHRGEQRWRCHGCGAGGTAIDLVMTACGTDLRGAFDELAHRTGHRPQPATRRPQPRRIVREHTSLAPVCHDQEGMDRYVAECAAALFEPRGQTIHQWLTRERGLTDDVLRTNRIGADVGPRHQWRPEGMPRVGGAVLPVISDGHAVYAQIRVPHPRPDRPRYLNPTSDLATNPRLAFFRPSGEPRPEVVVTEGTIDALSANVAGYRAAAVLSAAYPDQEIAHRLSRLPQPVVLAFDQDAAGDAAAQRLSTLLAEQGRPAVRLNLPRGDLNDALLRSAEGPEDTPFRIEVPESTLETSTGRALT